jgi:ketosteroid isomerase-like protein
MMAGMGERQQRNIAKVRAFYDAGPASSDNERHRYFADDFIWHVPGDSALSGPYSGRSYFVDMPARMQPLDEWRLEIDMVSANDDLVISSGRVRGRRLGRVIDATAGHVFRFDGDERIVEAWGWCADQDALDRFFAASS